MPPVRKGSRRPRVERKLEEFVEKSEFAEKKRKVDTSSPAAPSAEVLALLKETKFLTKFTKSQRKVFAGILSGKKRVHVTTTLNAETHKGVAVAIAEAQFRDPKACIAVFTRDAGQQGLQEALKKLNIESSIGEHSVKGCLVYLAKPAALEQTIKSVKPSVVVLDASACDSVQGTLSAWESGAAVPSLVVLSNTVTEEAAAGWKASNAATLDKQVNVAYTPCEGITRLQALFAFISKNCKTQKAVVGFFCKETSVFMQDVLFALNCPVDVFCDAEDEHSVVSQSFAAAKAGVFLTHNTQVVDTPAEYFIQYDPPHEPTKWGQDVSRWAQEELFSQFVLFMHPSEVSAAPPLIKTASPSVTLTKVAPPAVVMMGVTMGKLRGLMKKLFAVNNRAYYAYRGFLFHYVKISPQTVYNVRKLSLEKLANSYGMDNAPLLDLRTCDNDFRPKKNLFKVAAKAQTLEMRDEKRRVRERIELEAEEEEEEEEEEGAQE